jgi:hypothetical protein
MKNITLKAKNTLISTFLALTGVWIMFALSFQLYCVYLTVTNQDERMTQISNEISWRVDGTFKNNPKNIWYNK